MLPHATHVVPNLVEQVHTRLGGDGAAFGDEVVHVHMHLGAMRRGGWVVGCGHANAWVGVQALVIVTLVCSSFCASLFHNHTTTTRVPHLSIAIAAGTAAGRQAAVEVHDSNRHLGCCSL